MNRSLEELETEVAEKVRALEEKRADYQDRYRKAVQNQSFPHETSIEPMSEEHYSEVEEAARAIPEPSSTKIQEIDKR